MVAESLSPRMPAPGQALSQDRCPGGFDHRPPLHSFPWATLGKRLGFQNAKHSSPGIRSGFQRMLRLFFPERVKRL